MIDLIGPLEAIQRAVGIRPGEEGEVVSVVMQRRYEADIKDVWSALTEPERVQRWFYPLSGDLRAGGSFQLQGNAGGDILECSPPNLLELTFGGPVSRVSLRLTADGDTATVLELEHTVPIEMAQSGAGALYVGPRSLPRRCRRRRPVRRAELTRGDRVLQRLDRALAGHDRGVRHRYGRRDRHGNRSLARPVRSGRLTGPLPRFIPWG